MQAGVDWWKYRLESWYRNARSRFDVGEMKDVPLSGFGGDGWIILYYVFLFNVLCKPGFVHVLYYLNENRAV